jgi:radical S-adenosyl methionine domain-containing protein 2
MQCHNPCIRIPFRRTYWWIKLRTTNDWKEMALILAIFSSPVAQISLFIIILSVHFVFLGRYQASVTTPISVNYHFTRKCNKTCKFCFHTEKSSHVASDAEMIRGLRLLKESGMRKINFAGGEPFLYPGKLGWLCRYCKEILGMESVSIITNGTKVTEQWLGEHGRFVDVLGVSCDSFDERTGEYLASWWEMIFWRSC